MDTDCTLLVLSTPIDDIKSEKQIHHFLHGHPIMVLSKNKKDDQKVHQYCRICGYIYIYKGCTSPTPTYVCGRDGFCKRIYFHKSCLEFPQLIYHLFHPYHPLTLLEQTGSSGIWKACHKWSAHAKCSVITPAITTYEGHGHLLRFKEDIII